FDTCATTRGFTSHEMLDAVGAIHMNGRLYDPHLGRFLRADPFVQFPSNLQSHNRYSYALNNPLAYTDPSGHFIFTLAGAFYAAAAKFGFTATVATLAAAGFGDALLHGASFQQALQAGFISGVTAGAFHGAGGLLGTHFGGTFAAGLSANGFALKVLVHGAVGGITSALSGGRFGHGFASGGFTALGSGLNNSKFIGGSGFSPLRVAIGAAIGGTASRITGGKFANGAITGAFSQALNNEQAEAQAARQPQPDEATMPGVTRTDLGNGVLYEHEDGSSVLVQNDVAGGEIPDVNTRQVLDALAVSAQEGGRVQIISGYRGPGHDLYREDSAHHVDGAIDVRMEGVSSEDLARALHRTGRFNRVSWYTDGRTAAHADYRQSGPQGLFEDWQQRVE
ncbi:MAG: hypothetical protein F4149_12840, partial [Gammaproteobacteria bacterium]|nr:hypothetical protein [Gammaproteobacteria bacterium]MYH16047.1 hypothetical protein [Gammaproteobacteria bacterium]